MKIYGGVGNLDLDKLNNIFQTGAKRQSNKSYCWKEKKSGG